MESFYSSDPVFRMAVKQFEVLAERIVEGRPYKSVEDLRRVPGIGEKVFAELKDSLQIAP